MRLRIVTLTVTVLFAAGAGQAAAATLTVTTFDDLSGPGDGLCSLREAIAAVDSPGTAGSDCKPAAFGANTIVIPAGTTTLASHVDSTGQIVGELVIAPTVTNLTIVGAGETKTTIASRPNLVDRLLEISPGATVTIKDLTLTGGRAGVGNAGGDGVNGGAILNGGSLVLIDSAVTNSNAGAGGPGAVGVTSGGTDGGTGGDGGAGGSGGAIYNTGALTLQSTTIAGNSAGAGGAGGQGGGGTATGGNGGAGGSGGQAGGVANAGGTIAVVDSTFRGNDAGTGGRGGDGGPGPTAGTGGIGGSASGGGGIVSTGGSLSVTNSTFASNSAGDGGAGGDGARASGAGNAGPGGNGGSGGNGGGIDVLGVGSSALENVTIAGNSAGGGGAGGFAGFPPPAGPIATAGPAGVSGGIFSQGGGTTVQNSLLASNSGGNCSGSVLDSGHNLSFAGAGCPASFATSDPNLGPLQNNGGPAQTISLAPGSAAIDKVPATGSGCPATDERGVDRPSGSGCDIGAYEVAPPTATTGRAKSVTASTATVTASVTPNAGVATVQFQFGTSKKYRSTSAVQRIGGVVAVTVTGKLTRLRPGTLYHYRVTVVTPDGTAKAQDRTFKTSTHPALTNLSVKPASFRASGAGATITYIDTDPATTTFTVLRCAIPLSHARCARFVNVATFTHRDHAGHNKLRLRARIGTRSLSRGIYRLNARPRLAGKSGSTASAKFQILA
ncbi:MAG TPA: fibronectin type III domain-containing protein [Solirubrobacteraceae bacterium]|nr:fibronectin type III domain-containing protein [Solirubrobacteraceae bacterium]